MQEEDGTVVRRSLRSSGEWLTGGSSAGEDVSRHEARAANDPARIGRYPVLRKLGEGGMGVVYAARDDRLERDVAIKTLSRTTDDEAGRRLVWREARAAAVVNHPNVCQIYEVGEDDGRVFIVMELLEGESLASRLRRSALVPVDAVPLALAMLAALQALHDRGVVHGDLKPSNIFLTAHGVKLVDFGLARAVAHGPAGETDATRSRVLLGTPRYMAPEQVTGEPADLRADLFAVGAVLFEALAGQPAFEGRSVVDVLHATCHEQPPALTGSPEVVAIDRVIRRALAKAPTERFASADAMAEPLRSIHGGSRPPVLARTLTRLAVLPLRVLRPDPDTDFLAFSLPDAIATSLATHPSILVRSSAVAARVAGEPPDLQALATEVDVDRVVIGTLLRSGDQLRVAAQLVDAPHGTILTSHTVQTSMGDLFRLQDDLARRVSDALAHPLAAATPPTPDVPHDARAYELYLRANELARTYDGLTRARRLYQECLELDSRFAPAWARLGRCHRLVGKYIDEDSGSEARAEDALRRALALSPRLSIAHKFYANLEADIGQAHSAVVRLLDEAARHGNDPELFAGLVHASRYCGLLAESVASHHEARRLDPNVPTSLAQTFLMAGELEQLLALEPPRIIAGADDGIRVIGLGLAGHLEAAKERLHAMRQAPRIPIFDAWIAFLSAWLDRRSGDMRGLMASFGARKIQDDPEALFQEGWLFCDAGDHELGLELVARAVAKGYFVVRTLEERPQFDAIRRHPTWLAALDAAHAGRERARAAFQAAGGDALVGL